MYEIHLKGTLTSKRAMHVPVIRRWKLVWERREFGTQVDRIDRVFPLRFDAWENIPEGGVEVKLGSGFSVLVKRVLSGGQGDGLMLGVSVLYQGSMLPGTYRAFVIPTPENKKLLAWHTEVWKGVKVDVEATLSWSP